MLEGLDRIEWEELEHAYGTAEDVPGCLRQLTSQDPEVWLEGIDALYGTICHQTCTVYQATAAAVPFLIELLEYREVRCRGAILRLLADCARAVGFLQAHGSLSLYDAERETGEFQKQIAQEEVHTGAAHAAVWRGLDVYLRLLADPDPRLRVTAPYALGHLAEYAWEALPREMGAEETAGRISGALLTRMEREEEALVRASLAFGLGAVALRVEAIRRALCDLLSPACSRPVRVAAALCLAETAEPPVEAVEVLVETLLDWRTTLDLFAAEGPPMEEKHHPLAKAYRELGLPLGEESGTGYDPADVGAEEDFQFPWLHSAQSPRFACIARLCNLGPEHEARVLPALLSALEDETPYTVENVSLPILRFVFRGKMAAGTRSGDLTQAQRAVLERLYDNPLLWATDIGNPMLAFIKVGLPQRRKEWQALLEVEDRAYSETEARAVLERLVRQEGRRLRIPEEAPLTDEACARMDRLILRQLAGDEFVPLLARFPNLERLDLGDSRLTEAGLKALPDLPRLQNLSVGATGVTDAGAESLARFQALRELNLSSTRITDKALESVACLPDLRTLYLYHTSVSSAAVARFRAARPDVRVTGAD